MNPIDDKTRDKIVKLSKELKPAELAERFGLHIQTVREIVKLAKKD